MSARPIEIPGDSRVPSSSGTGFDSSNHVGSRWQRWIPPELPEPRFLENPRTYSATNDDRNHGRRTDQRERRNTEGSFSRFKSGDMYICVISYVDVTAGFVFEQLTRDVLAGGPRSRWHLAVVLPVTAGRVGVKGCWRRVRHPRRRNQARWFTYGHRKHHVNWMSSRVNRARVLSRITVSFRFARVMARLQNAAVDLIARRGCTRFRAFYGDKLVARGGKKWLIKRFTSHHVTLRRLEYAGTLTYAYLLGIAFNEGRMSLCNVGSLASKVRLSVKL